jgi:hypothetical protein
MMFDLLRTACRKLSVVWRLGLTRNDRVTSPAKYQWGFKEEIEFQGGSSRLRRFFCLGDPADNHQRM